VIQVYEFPDINKVGSEVLVRGGAPDDVLSLEEVEVLGWDKCSGVPDPLYVEDTTIFPVMAGRNKNSLVFLESRFDFEFIFCKLSI